MIAFLAGEFIRPTDNLEYLREQFAKSVERGESETELTPEERSTLSRELWELDKVCDKLGLPATHDRQAALQRRFSLGFGLHVPGCQYRVIATALEELLHSANYELMT